MQRHMRPLTLIASLTGLLVSLSPARGRPKEDPRYFSVSGDLGFGPVGDRVHATSHLGVEIREGRLALGLFGRVRFALADEQQVVRRRDYDEVSDYVHILRYLHYRRRFGSVKAELRAGELIGKTLGHGTLMRDYSNIADPDHLHAGISLQLSHERFDFAALVDNFIDPSVVAARFSVRPFSSFKMLSLGISTVLDPRAPLRVRLDDSGQRQIGTGYRLETESEWLGLAGIDIELALGDDKRGRITPYVDLNTSFKGLGVHIGSHGKLPLGNSGVALAGQVEYRATTARYAPAYVTTFYDVERYQAGLSFDDPSRAALSQRQTRLAALTRGHVGGHGVLGQLGVSWRDKLDLKAGYAFHPGPDAHRSWLRVTIAPIERLNLGALLMLRGLGQQGASVAGLAALAESRLRITSNLFAVAQYTRTWALDKASRYYQPLDSFNVGVGGSWSR